MLFYTPVQYGKRLARAFRSFEHLWSSLIAMDAVLKNIHYNSEVFSKIVEDFEYFLACTKPGAFRKALIDQIKPQDRFWDKVLLGQNAVTDLNEDPDRFWEEVDMLCSGMTTDKLEEGLKAQKKEPEIYREDFHQVATILEGADPEEEFDKWFAPLPCHFYFCYDTVMRILWIRNCQRYTTALRDTGKASLL